MTLKDGQAQWNHLHLPSHRAGFESLSELFLHNLIYTTICHWIVTIMAIGNERKRPKFVNFSYKINFYLRDVWTKSRFEILNTAILVKSNLQLSQIHFIKSRSVSRNGGRQRENKSPTSLFPLLSELWLIE